MIGGRGDWTGREAQRGSIDLVVASLIRRLLVRQQPIDDFDIFAEPRDAFLRGPVVDTHHAVGRVDLQSGADAEIEPSAGYMVGGQRLQSEQGRVAEGDLRNQGRQTDARRGHGDRGKLCPQLEPRPRAACPIDEMIRHADGVEAKFLDLTATPQKLVPGHVGQHEYGKPQAVWHCSPPYRVRPLPQRSSWRRGE
jgi:hypothetical protein